MTKDSLKKLLNKFPYFIDKRESSNFYKSQDVTNNRFQELHQSIFEAAESFKLLKKVWIWKEQNVPFDYVIHFVANYPHLKTVICYKNDDVICREDYSYDDNVSSFIHLYDSTMENDTLISILNDTEGENEETEDYVEEEQSIIPQDKFHIYIETYDEIIIEKGFPENDDTLNDIFDHDTSLDRIGSLNNIPRKNYIPTEDYSHTEPPYNNQLTEDDYHYMNRIINYLSRLHTTPLPVLEIWKLYGLEASMVNREKYLLKLFDETRHDFDYENEHVLDWIPKTWEHKDGFGDCTDNLGRYFFVSANTNFPKKWSNVLFSFKLMNNLAEELDENFTVEILFNNQRFESNGSSFFVPYTLLDEETTNIFTFIARNDNDIIGTEEMEINVQGCNNADFYVSSNGDDSNDGTIDDPFLTINKALEKVSNVRNMIVVQGEVTVNDSTIINDNCTILGCGNAIIHNDLSNKFFHITGNKNLTLSLLDITLDSNGAQTYIKSSNYTNNNVDYNNYLTVLVNGETPLISLSTDKQNYFTSYDNIVVSGTMKSKENNGIKNANLKIILAETVIDTSTDNNGQFTATIPIRELMKGDYDIELIFEGSDTYMSTVLNQSVEISKEPIDIMTTYGNSITLTSTGHNSGETVKFYKDNTIIESKTADSHGIASLDYLPEFGLTTIYTSSDGTSVNNEWIIETYLSINDLPTESFVTNIVVKDNGDFTVEETPLTDFRTINDLEDVLLDVSIDNENIFLNRFKSNKNDVDYLEQNNLCYEDIKDLFNAIISLSISDDSLICTRMGDLTEGE